ncbi:g8860 [Coccomyxa elongata]
MIFSPDFLTYFQYRTSYFPGLGWMMRRELWLEIGIQFPKQAWDHWMRLNTTSKGVHIM